MIHDHTPHPDRMGIRMSDDKKKRGMGIWRLLGFHPSEETLQKSADKTSSILKHAEEVVEKSQRIKDEQIDVSNQLKEERRKNHFSELIRFGVPAVMSSDIEEMEDE